MLPPAAAWYVNLFSRLSYLIFFFFFFSSRRRHTRFDCDWSSDVCSSDLGSVNAASAALKRSSCIFRPECGPRQEAPRSLPARKPLQACGRLNRDRKSTRLNSSHSQISYAVFCLKKKKKRKRTRRQQHRRTQRR